MSSFFHSFLFFFLSLFIHPVPFTPLFPIHYFPTLPPSLALLSPIPQQPGQGSGIRGRMVATGVCLQYFRRRAGVKPTPIRDPGSEHGARRSVRVRYIPRGVPPRSSSHGHTAPVCVPVQSLRQTARPLRSPRPEVVQGDRGGVVLQ